MTKLKILFTILIVTLAVSFTSAQGDAPPPPPNDFENSDRPQRGDRLAELLGLSDEQMLQVRQLNRQKRPQMREAQAHVKKVRDELDELIYADAADEVALQNKLRAVIEAQAEVIKIKTASEFAIRNVLTADQLVKFRELRIKAKKQRQQRAIRRNRRLKNQRRNNQNRRNNPPRNQPQRRGNRPL